MREHSDAFLPELPLSVRELLSSENEPLLSGIEENLKRLDALARRIPREYRWKFTTADAFNARTHLTAPARIIV